MAFRERVSLMSSKTPGNYLNFKPDTDINWLLRNFDTPGKSKLYFYNESASLSIEIDNALKGIHRKNEIFHCSNLIYYRLYNDESASNQLLAGDGYVSREDGKGDTLIQNIASVAKDSRLSMRPAPDVEWIIHTVMSNGAFDLYKVSSAGSIFSKRIYQPKTALTGLHLYCTNSVWWEIEQLDTGSVNMGYDGVRSK